jgi:hypothetical protein
MVCCADEFFCQRPNYSVNLAENLCQELATLSASLIRNFILPAGMHRTVFTGYPAGRTSDTAI